ncbi:hypothetical protein KY386_03620 [Candidatus Parcubacteria bacterium]|nr:hypothetical protein [Candidatus Parcubacteria bacterium]
MSQALDAAAERAKRLFWDHAATFYDPQPLGAYWAYDADSASRDAIEQLGDDELVRLLTELFSEDIGLWPGLTTLRDLGEYSNSARLALKGIAGSAVQTVLQADAAIMTEIEARWRAADRLNEKTGGGRPHPLND